MLKILTKVSNYVNQEIFELLIEIIALYNNNSGRLYYILCLCRTS